MDLQQRSHGELTEMVMPKVNPKHSSKHYFRGLQVQRIMKCQGSVHFPPSHHLHDRVSSIADAKADRGGPGVREYGAGPWGTLVSHGPDWKWACSAGMWWEVRQA